MFSGVSKRYKMRTQATKGLTLMDLIWNAVEDKEKLLQSVKTGTDIGNNKLNTANLLMQKQSPGLMVITNTIDNTINQTDDNLVKNDKDEHKFNKIK